MIKAKDLRHGNLVLKAKMVHVTEWLDLGHDYLLKPIPLTEEWLIRFGFEKKSNYLFCHINKDLSYVFKISRVSDENWMSVNATIKIPIKKVHELQNLYFALTGEELTSS